MALIDSAVNGLAGAVVSGLVAGFLWWTGRSKRAQVNDAWRNQADELDERLSKQYKAEIAYLRRQLEDCQGRLNRRRSDDRA